MAKKRVIRLITKQRRETCGRDRFFPNCALSRLLADVREGESFQRHTIYTLVRHGYKIEYSGVDHPFLDSIGATKIDFDKNGNAYVIVRNPEADDAEEQIEEIYDDCKN